MSSVCGFSGSEWIDVYTSYHLCNYTTTNRIITAIGEINMQEWYLRQLYTLTVTSPGCHSLIFPQTYSNATSSHHVSNSSEPESKQ